MRSAPAAPGPAAASPRSSPASSPSRLPWGVLVAGILAAVATGLVLSFLGVAAGALLIAAMGRGMPPIGVSGTCIGVWLLAANLIGFAAVGRAAALLAEASDAAGAPPAVSGVFSVAHLGEALTWNHAVGFGRVALGASFVLKGPLERPRGRAAGRPPSRAGAGGATPEPTGHRRTTGATCRRIALPSLPSRPALKTPNGVDRRDG